MKTPEEIEERNGRSDFTSRILRLLLRLAIGYILLMVWCFLPTRGLSFLCLFAALAFYLLHFGWPRLKLLAVGFLVAAFVATLLPFDIRFINAPGPPHFVPYVRKIPDQAELEREARGEILFLRTNSRFEDYDDPKYVLVW